MRKIMVISYYLYPNYLGGSEIAVYEICSRLKNAYKLAIMTNSDQDLQHRFLKKFFLIPINKLKRYVSKFKKFFTQQVSLYTKLRK